VGDVRQKSRKSKSKAAAPDPLLTESNLDKDHLEDLKASGLSDKTRREAKIYSVSAEEAQALVGSKRSRGWAIPYLHTGPNPYTVVKFDKANEEGQRYCNPKGAGNKLYIPPVTLMDHTKLRDVSVPIYITEGQKKALRACQDQLVCVSISGVDSWKTKVEGKSEPMPDLDLIPWKDRYVLLVFDHDPKPQTQVNVLRAQERLAQELTSRGARVKGIQLEPGFENQKIGLDDYLELRGIEDFYKLIHFSLATMAIVVGADEVKMEPLSWLWPGRIARRKLTLVVGDPEQGKSYVLLDLAARISRGGEFPDGTRAEQGTVIILTAEDSLGDTVKPRLHIMDADMSRIKFIEGVRTSREDRMVDLAVDLNAIRTAIHTHRGVVVMVDPINAYLGTSIDANRGTNVRRVLAPIGKLAEEMEVAWMGVMHLNKDQQKKLMYRIPGSIDFAAAARTIIVIAKDDLGQEDERLMLWSKLNFQAKPKGLSFNLIEGDTPVGKIAKVNWRGQVDRDPEELIGDAGSPAVREEFRSAMDVYREIIPTWPDKIESTKLDKLGKEAGVSHRQKWRAKKKLGVVSKQEPPGPGNKWFCWLPLEPMKKEEMEETVVKEPEPDQEEVEEAMAKVKKEESDQEIPIKKSRSKVKSYHVKGGRNRW